MISKKITDSDIAKLKVSALPSRPTAPKSFGGAGYTASDMKAAFDRLPLYIISRFNELIDDISGEGEEGISAAIPTGIREGHTLSSLMKDIVSGALASYLTVLGEPLTESIFSLKERISAISEASGSSASDAKLSLAKALELEADLEAINLALDGVLSTISELRLMLNAEAEQRESDIGELREDIGDLIFKYKIADEALNGISASIADQKVEIDELQREIAEPTEITIDCGGPADI